MNKYQEALDRVKNTENVDIKKINREVLKIIRKNHIEDCGLLQELVDKATPKKPLHRYITVCWSLIDEFRCPNCLSELYFHTDFKPSHCKCGQSLEF